MQRRSIGPYEVEERLGAGGMGEVFRAWDTRLERWVAIKTILATKELSHERRERLRREARSVASVSHPAVTQVFDIVTDEGRDHVVMELVEGRSLASWLEPGPLATEVAVDIARQIVAGLAAAHAKGIVHRDLKAENIIVSDDLRVKILDFGLAKRFGDDSEDTLTLEGVVMGTSRAMSPEQAEGRRVDHRSDLFSLGSLLYQMLTGRHPFAVSSNMETMRRVVYHRPEPVTKIAPGVPPELGDLTAALLAKKPSERPQQASDVAEVLDELARAWSSGTLSRPRGSLGTLTRGFSRRRGQAWLVAAAIAVVAFAAGGASWLLRAPPDVSEIAVMAPTIEASAAPEAADRAGLAVRTTALETVAALEGLAAIDPVELRNAGDTVTEIARAVAADEVLVGSVAGCERACRVTLRRVDPTGAVLWSGSVIEVPADDLPVLAQAVAAELRGAWPGHRTSRDSIVPDVAPELFRRYLEVRRLREDPPPDVRRDELLDRIEAIRTEDPGFLEAYLEEAELARYRFLESADPDYLERARRAVEEARRLGPDDPRVLRSAVSLAIAGGDLDAARSDLERLESLNPGHSRTMALRAVFLRASGDLDGSVELYRRVVAARPSAANLYNAAETEAYAGNMDAARHLLQQGLEIAPSKPSLLGKLAQLELMAGEPELAEALLRRQVDLDPGIVTWSNLGTARFLMRDYRGALEAYQRAHAIDPQDPVTRLNLGECHKVLGETDAAREWLEGAIAAAAPGRENGSLEAIGAAAVSLAHLGRAREAVSTIQEELRLAPEEVTTFYDAAVVHALLGEHASALTHAEQALAGGINPVWFDFPWFDDLRPDLELSGSLSSSSKGDS